MGGDLKQIRAAQLDRDRELRANTHAGQLGVIAGWAAATLASTFALLGVVADVVGNSLIAGLTCAGAAMTVLALPAAWLGRVLEQRGTAARMALLSPEAPELDALGPGLRALVADARLVCSAIEAGERDDELALRAAWEWGRRHAELGEADRDLLARLGDHPRTIAGILAWAVEAPDRLDQGLASIATELRALERALVETTGPYRG